MSGKHIELGDATLAPFFKGLKTLPKVPQLNLHLHYHHPKCSGDRCNIVVQLHLHDHCVCDGHELGELGAPDGDFSSVNNNVSPRYDRHNSSPSVGFGTPCAECEFGSHKPTEEEPPAVGNAEGGAK